MKIVAVVLLVALCALQYKAWFSDVGYFAARHLQDAVDHQQRRAELQRQRNRILRAEVIALKNGLAAVEARARTDLGMIKEGETFYLVLEEQR